MFNEGKLIKLLLIWVIQDNTGSLLYHILFFLDTNAHTYTHSSHSFHFRFIQFARQYMHTVILPGSFANSYFKFRKRSTHVFHFVGAKESRVRQSQHTNWIMLIEKLSKDLSVNFHPRVLTNIPKPTRNHCNVEVRFSFTSLSFQLSFFWLFCACDRSKQTSTLLVH